MSTAVLIIGAAISAGSLIGQVRDNTRRIELIETADRERVNRDLEILQRLTRIEGKFDSRAQVEERRP